MAHPLARDIRREGQEIAARLHVEYDEAGHAHDTRHHARCGCTHCKRFNRAQEDVAGVGLYDMERSGAGGFRVEKAGNLTMPDLVRQIEEIAKAEGKVCPCHPAFAELGGEQSPVPSAFAAARSGKHARVRRTERSHKSQRAERNGARCYDYEWTGVPL